MLTQTEIYNQSHNYGEGGVVIDVPFTGNLLLLELAIGSNLDRLGVKLGILYQYFGDHGNAYEIKTSLNAIALELPQTDRLRFLPVGDLFDDYTLKVSHATVGAVIDAPNDLTIPEIILGLPNRVNTLEAFETSANTQLTTSANAVTEVQSRLSTAESSITGLTSDIASHGSRLDTLESEAASTSTHLDEIDGILTSNGTALATLSTSLSDKADESEVSSLTSRVTTLESGSMGSVSDLTTRVTTLESTATSQGSAISSLNTAVTAKAASSDLTALTNRVTTNESSIDSINTSLTGKAGSSDLATLAGRVTTLEGASTGSSQNYISVSANATLQSNKNYYASVTGLVCALPTSPSAGDTINLATGNFTFRVNHGNSSQSILNLGTSTTTGTDSGIILKPYSSIQLIYLGSNLWISGYRSRTINNWLTSVVSPNQPITYTVTADQTADYGSPSGINDNVTATGQGASTGYFKAIAQATGVKFTVTLSTAIELQGFDFYNGQFNTASPLNSGNNQNLVDSVKVYSGNTTANLLGTFTLTKTEGKQTKTFDTGGNTYSQYLFHFFNSQTSQLSLIELGLFGKLQTGGEITAV